MFDYLHSFIIHHKNDFIASISSAIAGGGVTLVVFDVWGEIITLGLKIVTVILVSLIGGVIGLFAKDLYENYLKPYVKRKWMRKL